MPITNGFQSEFHKELQVLVNAHSIENESNTPDFVLANYLIDCLKAYENAHNYCNEWNSPEGVSKDTLKNYKSHL